MSLKKRIERWFHRWEDSDNIFAPPPTIPLAKAWLCQDCEKITEGHKEGTCFACDSHRIVPVSRYVTFLKQEAHRRVTAKQQPTHSAVIAPGGIKFQGEETLAAPTNIHTNLSYFLTATEKPQAKVREGCLFCGSPRGIDETQCTDFDGKHRWVVLPD